MPAARQVNHHIPSSSAQKADPACQRLQARTQLIKLLAARLVQEAITEQATGGVDAAAAQPSADRRAIACASPDND